MKKFHWLLWLCTLLAVPLLASAAQDSVAVAPQYDYQRDIKPIFEQKCIACHACYDAPCQLKMTSNDGLVRGASKDPVYDGARVKDAATTRLYVDAQTEAQWRDKNFFSVLEPQDQQAALMTRILALGQQQNWRPNQRLPEHIDLSINRSNQCSSSSEFDAFANKHPASGMPFAVTGLTPAEYQAVTTWLAEGAAVPEEEVTLSKAQQSALLEWEDWLNRPSDRERLVARYLYEHWFLAHLYFSDAAKSDQDTFFEVVRSRTPSGQPIEIIASRRPTDSPEGIFYYRLRPRTESRIHKTHITYPLSRDKQAHLQELFFADDWQVVKLSNYRADLAANPFYTFNAIPPRARYQFLLDNAEYFVRSFIRGPVCRGQIATDVIRDQFWVAFQDPDHDLFITQPSHATKVRDNLSMPGLDTDLLKLGKDWLSYRHSSNQYLTERQQAYAHTYPNGPTLEHLWDGDQHNEQALLTVFRHHDSASVVSGWQGDFPTTVWVMDYPLLERAYYVLVANFDVYGSVSHQAQTRLYFDLLRYGSEANLLRFLPAKERNDLLHAWYDNSARIKLFTSYADVDEKTPSQIKVNAQAPIADFSQQALTHLAKVAGPEDKLNRCDKTSCFNAQGDAYEANAYQLSRLSKVTANQIPAIQWLPEVTLLRVYQGEQRQVYTLLHNLDHSNVAFMLGEDRRLRPERDSVTIIPGIVGSYPNFIFNIEQDELPDFVTSLVTMQHKEGLHHLADRYGIRRTHPEFWFYFHDMHHYLQETQPLEAGLLDMNRYENL